MAAEGAGAILLGKLFEALPATAIVFVLAYTALKKNRHLSRWRAFGLFWPSFALTGIIYAALYNPINSGFGLTVDEGLQGLLDIPVQVVLAAAISLLLLVAASRKKQPIGA